MKKLLTIVLTIVFTFTLGLQSAVFAAEETPMPEPTATLEVEATPIVQPTIEPTPEPTSEPTLAPTPEPTPEPTAEPEEPPIQNQGEAFGAQGEMAAQAYSDYHAGDIAAMNTLIQQKNLEKGTFNSGDPSPPTGWTGVVTWDNSVPKRIIGLNLSYLENLEINNKYWSGTLDVSALTALESLNCNYNGFTALNVNGLMALKIITCRGSELTSLDVSGLSALKTLYCEQSNLTALNVSGCTALESIQCGVNNLTTLDVSGLTSLESLHCEHNQLTALSVSGCTALSWLDCEENQLITLDVSGLTALGYLYCSQNRLSTLNASGCIALNTLKLDMNNLATLNVSGCTALDTLDCNYNSLTTLNVSGCTMLTGLGCSGNELRTLDVSTNTMLSDLDCSDNSLKTLDLSKNTKLTKLWCNANYLTTLNLSKNAMLSDLGCSDNPLTQFTAHDGRSMTILSSTGGKAYMSDYELDTKRVFLEASPNSWAGYRFKAWKVTSPTGLTIKNDSLALNQNTVIQPVFVLPAQDTSIKPTPIKFTAKNEKGVNRPVDLSIDWGFDLFKKSPAKYDSQLAIAACALSEAAYSEKRVETLLGKLGFEVIESKNHDNSRLSSAYSIACKKIELDGVTKTVFAVVNRGSGEGSFDWIGNIAVEMRFQAGYFESCAKTVAVDLKKWISIYGSSGEGNNIFLVTGHSLGGVVTDILVSTHLSSVPRKNVFAYAFAPPLASTRIQNKNNMYIHNIINAKDIIPGLPPGLYGRLGSNNYRFAPRAGNPGMAYWYKYLSNTNISNLEKMNNNPLTWPKTVIDNSNHNLTPYMAYVLAGGPAPVQEVYGAITGAMIGIKCPVDVEVYNKQSGALVCRIVNNTVDGSVPLTEVFPYIDGDQKFIYLPQAKGYTVRLTGTNTGTMTYEVYDYDSVEGVRVSQKVFTNVALFKGKTMVSDVDDIADTKLQLTENGKVIGEIAQDGAETILEGTFKLNKSAVVLKQGKSVKLKASISPKGSDKVASWKSSKPKIAKVNKKTGKVTALKKGKAVITAKTANGKEAKCTVYVDGTKVSKVTLSKKTATLRRGRTLKLKATVTPTNASHKKVTWKSSKPAIATVSAKGVVKGVKRGRAVITAVSQEGGRKAKCTVTVK